MPYASRNGTRLFWTEYGAGEPLLLIMGLGATHVWWHRVTPVVAARFRTIVFDNRGVGDSDVPAGPYAIEEMAADAIAVLDAAGIATAHVYGASMGGMIAQELVLAHPDRVRSLILGCTACGGRDAVPARKEVRDALTARVGLTREAASWAMVPYTFDKGTPRARIEEDLAVRLAANVPNEGYLAQLGGIRAWQGTLPRLPAITAPTLVIHGESDELVPPENSRIIARAIPNATLVMIPNASHIYFTDQADAASNAILSFLGQQVGA